MKRRAQIKHPISFWNTHVDAWQSSGLNQREYCRQHGLREKAFGHHKIRCLGSGNNVNTRKASPPKLDLVALPIDFLHGKTSQSLNNSSGISITFGRKTRIEISPCFDSACLAAVLKVVVDL